MTESEENKRGGHISTTVIAVLTLTVTAVAAIPGFLSLNEDHAAIYYSVSTSGIEIPDSMDETAVRKILSENGIPSDTLSISVVNQGNAAAEHVRLSVDVPGRILASTSTPKPSINPIWVNLPKIDVDQKSQSIRFSVQNLGTTKELKYEFGYQRENTGQPEIEVFHAGQPAERVSNVAHVPTWSPWRVFELPLIILGGGVAPGYSLGNWRCYSEQSSTERGAG